MTDRRTSAPGGVRWLGWGLLAVALSGTVAAAPSAPTTLVAFSHDYGHPDEVPLRHTAADAKRVAAVMRKLGGVSASRRFVVNDGSTIDVRRAFEAAARRSDKNGLLVVYAAAHGDDESLHLAGETLRLDTLLAWAYSVPARSRVIVIDSCRATGSRIRGLVPDGQPVTISAAPAGPSGMVVVRSSSLGEAAQESDILRGGVFTHHFVSGLRGAADRDQDERVSLDEAYTYAFRRTLQTSAALGGGVVQHPSVRIELEGAGPLVLTHTSRASARLVLPPGKKTQYLVYRLPALAVVAEAWSNPDRVTSLAVPRGRFLVQQRRGGRFSSATVRLPHGGAHNLSQAELEPLATHQVALRGATVSAVEHTLSAGYRLTGATAGVGHGVTLDYSLRFPAWSVGVSGVFDQFGGELSGLGLEEMAGGLDLQLAYLWDWASVSLRLGGGPAVRWIQRTSERPDADRLTAAGLSGNIRSDAVGAGGRFIVGVDVPVAGPMFVSVRLDATVLAVPEGDRLTAWWRVGGGLGVGFWL